MIASDPPHLTPDQSKREQRVGQLATRSRQNTYHKTRPLWPHKPTEVSWACERRPLSLLTTSSAASTSVDVFLRPSLQSALAVGCAIICTAAYGYGYGCSGVSGCVCSAWAVRSRIIGKWSRAHILDVLSLSGRFYSSLIRLGATDTFGFKSLTSFNLSRQCLDHGLERCAIMNFMQSAEGAHSSSSDRRRVGQSRLSLAFFMQSAFPAQPGRGDSHSLLSPRRKVMRYSPEFILWTGAKSRGEDRVHRFQFSVMALRKLHVRLLHIVTFDRSWFTGSHHTVPRNNPAHRKKERVPRGGKRTLSATQAS
jgi:hypothetical protein